MNDTLRKIGRAVEIGEAVADHPLVVRIFGWLMSPERIAIRRARRKARRARRAG